MRVLQVDTAWSDVDRTFAFEQLREAMQYLASGRHFGKICIRH